jgi:hypothetical protein
MANVAVLLVKGATSSVIAPSAGAAAFTVPLDYSDHRAVLLINNRNTDVEVRANVEYGDAPFRACLGDLDVDIAVSSCGAIPFTDSMRHKIMTTDSVTVNLRDTSDTVLTAGPLANIDMVLIQG